MTWTCPVCGYRNLEFPPRDKQGHASHETCQSCGFEFGVSDDDLGFTYDDWRESWAADGFRWYGTAPVPNGWNGRDQLAAMLGEGRL